MVNGINKPLVLDGGFSSQLAKYVTNKVDGDPLWTSRVLHTDPEAVVKTHLDYLRAGADIITTNSYQASIGGFMKHLNLSYDQSSALIGESVKLARKACDIYGKENGKKVLIAGSIGPYGAALNDGSEFSGNYITQTDFEVIKEWHKPRLDILIESGVDLIAFETIPCISEAHILLQLLKEYPNVRGWLSFSCRDDCRISKGEQFSEALQILPLQQLIAIGVNCLKPQSVEHIFRDQQLNGIDLITYPNSGEDFDKELGWIGAEQCIPMYKYVETWLHLGVKIIGGCCRTQDNDINDIRKEVDRIVSKSDFSN